MGKVLGINYYGSTGAMLGRNRSSAIYHSPGFGQLMEGPGTYNIAPNSMEELTEAVDARLRKDMLVVSGDHVVSYPLFSAIGKNRSRFDVGKGEKLGLVVLDQHVDGYESYRGLCRPNVLRRLIEDGKVKHVVVAGVRPSEYAIFTGERSDRNGLPFINRLVARLYHKEFDGLHDNITVVPLESARNLPDAIDIGLKELAKRGIVHVGLDVDADVFDSGEIKGVGFSLNNLGRFPFPERQFIRRQLGERGMPAGNIENDLTAAANDVLSSYDGKLNVVLRGLTEIEPENEGLTNEGLTSGNTKKLVRAFAEKF